MKIGVRTLISYKCNYKVRESGRSAAFLTQGKTTSREQCGVITVLSTINKFRVMIEHKDTHIYVKMYFFKL